ncbi:hypothetical protein EVAR_93878_1 [Eumeta japonica]|uniref:Uncharacterized protein n=1 Tax=Eumeta variegata TaxID=151549 RepID=A0A4C1TWP5_EUMVA|nr:hypothetical protein EVAR_93878_1 [Eumeta japonica]
MCVVERSLRVALENPVHHIGGILKMDQILSTRNGRAYINILVDVSEAREICKDRTMYKSLHMLLGNRLYPLVDGFSTLKDCQLSTITQQQCVLPKYPENGSYFVIDDKPAKPGDVFDNVSLIEYTRDEYFVLEIVYLDCARGAWSRQVLKRIPKEHMTHQRVAHSLSLSSPPTDAHNFKEITKVFSACRIAISYATEEGAS